MGHHIIFVRLYQGSMGESFKMAEYEISPNPDREITSNDIIKSLMYIGQAQDKVYADYCCDGKIELAILGTLMEYPPHIHRFVMGNGSGQSPTKLSKWGEKCPTQYCNGHLVPFMASLGLLKVYRNVGLGDSATLSIYDSSGGALTRTIVNQCNTFSELPIYAPHKYYVKVLGDIGSNSDDYYLEFKLSGNDNVEDGKMGEEAG